MLAFFSRCLQSTASGNSSSMKAYSTLQLVLLLAAMLLRPTLAAFTIDSSGCSNAGTCSPTWCAAKVSNSACSPASNKTDDDFKSEIGQTTCKSCNASSAWTPTDPRCTTAALTSAFSTYPGILLAYCTPSFLVVWSSGLANHPTWLDWVLRPPGGGGSGGYPSQCVTRHQTLALLVFKIPLSPVALSSSSTSNNVPFPVSGSQLTADRFALPKSGPVGMMLNGEALFPAPNDQSAYSWTVCELDLCNAHAGKGFDYHYHGDPFGDTGKCMYSASSYTSTASHPPLIGYGLDGFPIYGRHLSASAPGTNVDLDDCGGHTHDSYGYHYHSQLVTMVDSESRSYTSYISGPHKCWKGDISRVEHFWVDLSKGEAAWGAGRIQNRLDYDLVRSCCGVSGATRMHYAKTGFSLPTETATTPPSGLSPTTIGIIVGCSCGGAILIAIAAFFVRRRHLLKQEEKKAPPPASAPPMEMTHVHQLPAHVHQQSHVTLPDVPRTLQQA